MELLLKLNGLSYYPKGVTPINCGIKGTGFFPGANGVWSPGSSQEKKVMILGHDFGNFTDYELSEKRGEENMKALTWRNMLRMLENYGIDKEDCFFTNILLGARTEGSAIGNHPAINDDIFVNQCLDFLIYQINVVQPDIVLVLGLHAMQILARLGNKLEDFGRFKNFKILDTENKSIISDISFSPSKPFSIIFLTHPTYWHLNVRHRRYQTFEGIAAERAMIRAVQ